MERSNILNQLQEIFRGIVGNNSINFSESSSASEIEEWDSLNHIQFISAVEKHYQIRFDLDDLLEFENIGDLISGIESKTSGL